MKSLFGIYRRYLFSACWIAVVVILFNMAVFGVLSVHLRFLTQEKLVSGSRGTLSELVSHLREDPSGAVEMEAAGCELLERAEAAWAILLDDAGTVIWRWRTPEEIPERFTSGEVAAFSRWYLKDYPVRVWKCEQGLFVFARPKNSVGKYMLEVEETAIRNLPWMFLILFLANLFLTLLLAVAAGYRMYKALRPVALGIDGMALGRRVSVQEHGIAGELGRKLNQVSGLLEDQRRNLDRRDTARTEWISGVSHDIRTPLSMVMGYADNLENDDRLPEDARKEARIIREQSLKIRRLIEDLNLTSKLEYHMQPLRVKEFMPAALIRGAVVSVLNAELPEGYELEADIREELEGKMLQGDENLILRALQNLIGNSIRHNTACHIVVKGGLEEEEGMLFCLIGVRDDGKGIPVQVRDILGGREPGPGPDGARDFHVMGLRIAGQIAEAHGGDLRIAEDGREVTLRFPIYGEKSLRKKKETWWEILWYGKERKR